MKPIRKFLHVVLVAEALVALALRQALAMENRCPVPSSLKDLVGCVLKNHPDVQRAELDLSTSQASLGYAAQRPNPDFESETLGVGAYGQGRFQQSFSYLHPFELGGKRPARQSVVSGQIKVSESIVIESKSMAFKTLMLLLHQVKIKEREMETVEEAFQTFQKLIKQYENRRHKSAEQQVAENVFKVSAQDFQLKRAQVLDAQAVLSRILMTVSGLTLADVKGVIPSMTEWKELPPDPHSLDRSPEMITLQANKRTFEAELNLAHSLAYPDLRIGPSYQYLWDPTFVSNFIGIRMTLPLPLYNTNTGGKALAQRSLESANQKVLIRRRELQLERDYSVRIYQDTVQALKLAQTIHSIENKHLEIESLFLQGLVSSALLIEAHRQLLEAVQTLGERELRATEARLRVEEIDGNLLKEYLP